MKFRLLVVIAAALLIAADAPEKDVKAEMKKMEGTWRLVSAISDGKPWPDERVKAITIAIKADGTWVEDDGKEKFEATFTIDPRKSPKTANFLNESGKMKGLTCLEIYDIDGDTMKMCFVVVPTGKESTKERPSKFASEVGSGHYLSVMKREKNPPDPEKIVQEQVEAFNKRDIDAFLATYSADVKLHDFPGKETLSGQEEMRKAYGKLFADTPYLKAVIKNKIIQGDTVIFQEEVSGKGSCLFLGVAIYQVKDEKIAAVWFVK
jgi:uncharacterized protein (TIGR03067 family)